MEALTDLRIFKQVTLCTRLWHWLNSHPAYVIHALLGAGPVTSKCIVCLTWYRVSFHLRNSDFFSIMRRVRYAPTDFYGRGTFCSECTQHLYCLLLLLLSMIQMKSVTMYSLVNKTAFSYSFLILIPLWVTYMQDWIDWSV